MTAPRLRTPRYVIIGNGVAGMTAAQEIRHADPKGGVTIIGNEADPFYYRASLSKWISGESTAEMIGARTRRFYEEMSFERVQGTVARVDPEQQHVTLNSHDGGTRTVPYDKLLIATGASANRIPIEGLHGDAVYRTWDDAREIKARIKPDTRVLILGGGVLGLELAGALVSLGLRQIALVQLMDFLGPPLLDEPAGRWLEQRMRADGLALFLSDTVERVETNIAHLKSGKTWAFDLFVQSVGVRPRYPDVPGLEVGKAIRIDKHGATNLPHIYAAGDCTETLKPSADHGNAPPRWQPTRIWLDCARQGKVAGRVMAGVSAALGNTPFFNASILYDVNYAYIGDPNGDGGDTALWTTDTTYRKIRLVEGRLAGAMLMGNRNGMLAIHRAVGLPVQHAGTPVAHPAFPWNDLTGKDWDYLFY